jgi:hypothetical protein
VPHDHLVVLAEVQVEFECVYPEVEGNLERRQRVLGPEAASASVSLSVECVSGGHVG